MQKLFVRIFLFLLINILLLFLHIRLFNIQPAWGFISGAVHGLLLLLFPYSRFFKNTSR